MQSSEKAFVAHVATGVTTLCRCWALTRRDGTTYGFTDHDCDLGFEGTLFRAQTGLSAMALQQSTGLAIDNTEALGALCDAAVRDEDIEAGRFDGAEIRCWQVNWADPEVRRLQFRGTIGEIRRAGGAFRAELRGLGEALNTPLGRVYQKPCTSVLGDSGCRFDMKRAGYSVESEVAEITQGRRLAWDALPGFEEGWFERGRLSVLTGAAKGLWSAIKSDRVIAGKRVVELWEPVRGTLKTGERVRLDAGCDKRLETCRLKFDNVRNFQGFPDIPGEDWIMAVPRQSGRNGGGSRR